MNAHAILFPVIALALGTHCVLGLVPFQRVRAYFRRQVGYADFKFGESTCVPPAVAIPNRNYMNLLEAPQLFYVACLRIDRAQVSEPAVIAGARM